MDDLELCEYCLKKTITYVYDFNRRCCRARHTLTMPKEKQIEKLKRMAEKYGREFAEQHRADVRIFRSEKKRQQDAKK